MMKNNKYTILSFLGMLVLSVMLVSCYSLWDDLSAVPKVTITYVSEKGTPPASKQVNVGYKLTAADLPNMETDTEYGEWDKTVGTEITADTTITATWDDNIIVYFDKSKISSYKTTAEKIIFTTDSYTGTGTTIDCADNSTNSAIGADYFTGVLDGTTLTIYGNGHRIYAPENSSSLFNGFSKVTNIEFNNFYTSKVTNMQQMFYNCKALTSLDLSSFDTSAVTNMMAMFGWCNKLPSLNVSSFNTSNVTDMTGMFMQLTVTELNLSNFDTSRVTSMKSMFTSCENLTSVNLSSFNTSCVKDMMFMFQKCTALETLDVSKFNTSSVTTTAQMFESCKKLKELDLSGFDTSSVTDMARMFTSCESLKELDLSSFDTSSVEKMVGLFEGSKSLERILFSSNFKTEKVPDMSLMFKDCSKLTVLDISMFNTEKVENMLSMFEGCEKLTVLDISSFDFTSMPDGKSFKDADVDVFKNCSSLVTIYATNNFKDTMSSVFGGCSKLVGGAGTACNGTDNINARYACIDADGTPGYFTLKQ